jgi:hypothetical protein
MTITIPLKGLKSQSVASLKPGAFFYKISAKGAAREYCLRADPSEPRLPAWSVSLGGDDRFYLDVVNAATAGSSVALAIPTGDLFVKLGVPAAVSEARYTPGNLLVDDDDAYIVVTWRSLGSENRAVLSVSTWKLLDPPDHCACFENWELLSRGSNGVDTSLLKVGS